jgi:hypothetical protein
MRPCSHIWLPLHSLQLYFIRPCSHIWLPLHSLQQYFLRPCWHFFSSLGCPFSRNCSGVSNMDLGIFMSDRVTAGFRFFFSVVATPGNRTPGQAPLLTQAHHARQGGPATGRHRPSVHRPGAPNFLPAWLVSVLNTRGGFSLNVGMPCLQV